MSETFEFGVGEVNDVESQKPSTNLVAPHDDASSVTSDGHNNKFIIDNLSPTWGIMLTVQDNLNLRIGMQLKKKYFKAGFWNYISTPINFAITLFTALSAGQLLEPVAAFLCLVVDVRSFDCQYFFQAKREGRDQLYVGKNVGAICSDI